MTERPQFSTSPESSTEQKEDPAQKSFKQEDFLAPGALRELARRIPETVETHKVMVANELARYGVKYNKEISLNENINRLKILKNLQGSGILEIKNGEIFFDPVKVREWRSKRARGHRAELKLSEIISALSGLRGYNREEAEIAKANGKETEPSLKEIIAIPKSAKELSEFVEQSHDSIVNVWDFERRHKWETEIKAQNGDKLNLVELRIAAALYGDLRAKRDKHDRLMVYDKKQERERLFTPTLFKELTGLNPSVKTEVSKWTTSFASNPIIFINKHGQNLLKAGLLRKEDFGINRGSSTSELFDLERRRLVYGRNNYIVFKSGRGYSARYYMGRTKVVGTEIPINDNVATVKLDQTTAGVIESRLGVSKLLYTIELFGPDEVQKKREQVAQTYLAKHHKEAPPMELTSRTIFNGSEVESRVKEYDVTKYLPQRDGESAADYGRRINNLQNIDFVVRTSRDFFSAAGIGIHNLPWSEQLILANAIFETPSPEKLKEFVEQYGKNGVRTFLSLNYGKDLGDKIVELGNTLDSKAASEIFSKYGQIVDAAHDVGSYVKQNFGQDATVDGEVVGKIVENLLSRGKDLLVHFADTSRAAKQKGFTLDSESILRELSDIRTETMLFLSSFKTLRREGIDLDFRAIKDVEFYSTPGSALSEEDLRRMKEMYAKNYAYAPEIRDELLSGFDQAVASSKTTFYLLRYKGEIASFVRFDEEKGGRLHAASLNVDPQFRGSAIGETVMEKTLDMKAKSAVLYADCSALADVGAHYVETGFTAQRYYLFKGEPSFDIERDDTVVYPGRLLSKEEIASRYIAQSAGELGDMRITASSTKNPDELDFGLLNHRYVLTRYFKLGEKWYCVFELKATNENVGAETQAA